MSFLARICNDMRKSTLLGRLACLFLVLFGNPLFAWDYDSICAYIEERFEHADIFAYPFPHIVIKDILPEDYYRDLCNSWPSKSFDKQSPTWRKLIEVGNTKKWGRGEDHDKWIEFAKLVDNVIKRKLAEVFYPLTPHRLGYFLPSGSLCNATSQFEHRLFQDYHHGVGIHIDKAYKLAAVMIYFPIDYREEHSILGTVLYRHKNLKESIDYTNANSSECIAVKQLPYAPNTLCAFFQAPHGWHSAPMEPSYQKIRNSLPSRRSYFTNIYLTPTFMKTAYGTMFGLEEDFFDETESY